MPTSDCPFAYDHCRAARPAQNQVDPEILQSLGVEGDWLNNAYRCSHCGGHWSVGSSGEKLRRGYIEASGWVPVSTC
jgi:hypothetical protein